jgi:threonine/homoserine/homoserine lactone efflux protein
MDRNFMRLFVILLMFGFSALCLSSAIFTSWAFRNNRTLIPIKNEKLRKVILIAFAVVFLLSGLLLLYGAFMPVVAGR